MLPGPLTCRIRSSSTRAPYRALEIGPRSVQPCCPRQLPSCASSCRSVAPNLRLGNSFSGYRHSKVRNLCSKLEARSSRSANHRRSCLALVPFLPCAEHCGAGYDSHARRLSLAPFTCNAPDKGLGVVAFVGSGHLLPNLHEL